MTSFIAGGSEDVHDLKLGKKWSCRPEIWKETSPKTSQNNALGILAHLLRMVSWNLNDPGSPSENGFMEPK